MIDTFYSTVGLYLDILVMTLPMLLFFKVDYFKGLQAITIIWLVLFVTQHIILNQVLVYTMSFILISALLYGICKINYKILPYYVMYGTSIFLFDVIGYVLFLLPFGLSPSQSYPLLVYGIVYKLLILSKIVGGRIKVVSHPLKLQLLIILSQSGVILIGLGMQQILERGW